MGLCCSADDTKETKPTQVSNTTTIKMEAKREESKVGDWGGIKLKRVPSSPFSQNDPRNSVCLLQRQKYRE